MVEAATRTAPFLKLLLADAGSLNHAVAVCLKNPRKLMVRGVRKTVRRMEGDLTLFKLLRSHMPPDPRQSTRIRKCLRHIGRAAGAVRDLDVQIDLVKVGSGSEPDRETGAPDDPRNDGTESLLKHLERRREKKAEHLVHALRKTDHPLAVALRGLEDVLGNSRLPAVPPKEVATLIEGWFRKNTAGINHSIASMDESQKGKGEIGKATTVCEIADLHALRKYVKLCRYMVESLPLNSGSILALTTQLKAIQTAGGIWHDWLLLEITSKKHSGKDVGLTERYAKSCHYALIEYRKRLAGLEWLRPGVVLLPMQRRSSPVHDSRHGL